MVAKGPMRTDWPVLRIKLEHVDGDARKITVGEITAEKFAQESGGTP